MSTKLQKLIVFGSVFILMAMFGCASFQDVATPSYIPPAAIEYADANGTSMLPWTTLFDAKRIKMKMAFVHSVRQVSDKMKYEFLNGLMGFHIGAAEEAKAAFFSPTGPIGLLVPALAGTAMGGLLIKRPGDKSKKEIKKENNK